MPNDVCFMPQGETGQPGFQGPKGSRVFLMLLCVCLCVFAVCKTGVLVCVLYCVPDFKTLLNLFIRDTLENQEARVYL